MSDKERCKQIMLEEFEKGNVITVSAGNPSVHNLKDMIDQPINGLLYDLNLLEETSMSTLTSTKDMNSFAVAKVIRELYSKVEELTKSNKIISLDGMKST